MTRCFLITEKAIKIRETAEHLLLKVFSAYNLKDVIEAFLLIVFRSLVMGIKTLFSSLEIITIKDYRKGKCSEYHKSNITCFSPSYFMKIGLLYHVCA